MIFIVDKTLTTPPVKSPKRITNADKKSGDWFSNDVANKTIAAKDKRYFSKINDVHKNLTDGS